MTRYLGPVSAAALLAAGLAVGAPRASAADLGGDCCADLEERVAELEATTARKGNRKVSLEVSGHVNQAVMYWDDGEESNVYVVTNDTSRSRFRFKGKAKVTDDVEAGYLLEIGVRTARSDRVDQGCEFSSCEADDPETTLDVRHSSWYLKSKKYGAVWVGETEEATESITEINLANTGEAAKNADVEDYYAGFQLRAKGGGLSQREWRNFYADGDALQPGEGNRGNFVRYVSPEFSGFTASAAWGEDDEWSAALRYAGEFNGIKIAAGIGYTDNTESELGRVSGAAETRCFAEGAEGEDLPNGDAECHQLGGSASVMHVASGVFVTFAAGWFEDENIEAAFDQRFGTEGADDESTFYSFQAGIEQKWNALGKTTLFGEYYHYDGGANSDDSFAAGDAVNPFGVAASARLWDSEVEVFGAGVVQAIDAAAMSVYLVYRHFEADATFLAVSGAPDGELRDAEFEDLDVVMSGAAIKF